MVPGHSTWCTIYFLKCLHLFVNMNPTQNSDKSYLSKISRNLSRFSVQFSALNRKAWLKQNNWMLNPYMLYLFSNESFIPCDYSEALIWWIFFLFLPKKFRLFFGVKILGPWKNQPLLITTSWDKWGPPGLFVWQKARNYNPQGPGPAKRKDPGPWGL